MPTPLSQETSDAIDALRASIKSWSEIVDKVPSVSAVTIDRDGLSSYKDFISRHNTLMDTSSIGQKLKPKPVVIAPASSDNPEFGSW